MSPIMHASSVPVFRQMLGALDAIIAKAEAHVASRSIEPSALTQARLFPDMFPLARQVQVACDFARGISARLAGVEVPVVEEGEPTFAGLHALIGKTLGFIEGLDASLFDAAAGRDIVTRPGTPKERRFTGQHYLLSYGLPQFFFHVTTAYAILRHNGLEIGKRDYMGEY